MNLKPVISRLCAAEQVAGFWMNVPTLDSGCSPGNPLDHPFSMIPLVEAQQGSLEELKVPRLEGLAA